MTLDEAIEGLDARADMHHSEDAFVQYVLGRTRYIVENYQLNYSNRQRVAAGILDGYKRGNRKTLVRELGLYWHRHYYAHPEPEPEWVRVPFGEIARRFVLSVRFATPDGRDVELAVAGRGKASLVQQHTYRFRIEGNWGEEHLLLEKRTGGPS
jgi:hypothetical protein